MHVKKEIRSWWLSSLLLLGILMVNIGCGGDNASVADVIKFGNIEYLRVSQHGGRFITSNDLGPIFAYVQIILCKMEMPPLLILELLSTESRDMCQLFALQLMTKATHSHFMKQIPIRMQRKAVICLISRGKCNLYIF